MTVAQEDKGTAIRTARKARHHLTEAERVAELCHNLPRDQKPRAFALLKSSGFTDRPIKRYEFVAELLRLDRPTLLQLEYAIEFLRDHGRFPGR